MLKQKCQDIIIKKMKTIVKIEFLPSTLLRLGIIYLFNFLNN